MSLTGAISSAVTALNAQSQVLSMVSDNLANVSTYGYKTTYGDFASMVTDMNTSSYSSGGVSVSTRSNIGEQGLLTSSSTKTNVAIDGSGMLAVRAGLSGTDVEYTRDGAFAADANGYLTNNGNYLLGWRTDADGNVTSGATSGSLTPIDTTIISSTASATTQASLVANLPAEASTGDTFTSSMELEDSLGTKAKTTITWTKTGDNTWSASFGDPTSSDGTTTLGSVTSSAINVTFNADGTLASTSPDPATLTIGSWTTGAADSSIALNLGTASSADGLSQYSTGADTPTVSLKTTQNGIYYGALTSISIDDAGIVWAGYDNSQTIALYKIPVATFNNVDGLAAGSNGIYYATDTSGDASFVGAGTGGAGTIKGGELEASTTDTNAQFSTMMASQQAYSAAAQVITTAKSMFDTLISAVR